MALQTYRILGIPGFDNLHATGEEIGLSHELMVSELINLDVVVGDRHLRYPIPHGAISINMEYLMKVDDITCREFASDNPFGKFKSERRCVFGNLVIVSAEYKNAVTVTIFENNKTDNARVTLFTCNFFKTAFTATRLIDLTANGKLDAEDLIFELKNIQAENAEDI